MIFSAEVVSCIFDQPFLHFCCPLREKNCSATVRLVYVYLPIENLLCPDVSDFHFFCNQIFADMPQNTCQMIFFVFFIKNIISTLIVTLFCKKSKKKKQIWKNYKVWRKSIFWKKIRSSFRKASSTKVVGGKNAGGSRPSYFYNLTQKLVDKDLELPKSLQNWTIDQLYALQYELSTIKCHFL